MQAIKNTLAENFGGKAQELGSSQFSLDDIPNLEGKVAVVTGGSEGIGYGVTHTLLSKGISKLFITSVREITGRDALEELEEELGADRRNRVVYIQTDQSDWKEAAKVAKEIASQTDRIDIVVLNAARGIMTAQKAETNGTDLHLAINHVGHAVFLSNLLPILTKTADAGNTVRIAALSSNIHESAPSETEFKSVDEWNKDYGPNAQYGRSKLANFLYIKYLHTHLHSKHPNILANATHPGIVDTAQTTTHIHEAYPLLGYGMSAIMKPFQKTQFEGAMSTLFAATKADKSGLYITPPCIVEPGSDKGNDPQIAENLMRLTKQLVDEKAGPGVLKDIE